VALIGASLPQFFTPGSHLFLGDRTVPGVQPQQRLAGARRGLGRGTCSWYLRGGGRAGSFRPVNGLVIDAIRNSVPSSAGRPAVTSASPIAADQASSSRWTTPPTAPGIRPLVTSGPAALWAVMYKAERQL